MKRPPENNGASGKDLVPFSTNGSGSKVPAPRHRNFFASFRALTDAFDEQIETHDNLCAAWRERNQRVDFAHQGENVDYARHVGTRARESAERCAAEMMQQPWKAALENGEDLYHPSDEYIMLRISSMGSANPKIRVTEEYGTRLAERLGSEEPSMMVCESIFREIEDTWKKETPPGFPDVLPLLEKHKRKWQQRLLAIDLDNIQAMGEQTIFALEFKHAIFKEAVLEYLDAHGHTDLAASVRDGEFDPYLTAIHGTARTEGLTEQVAKIEAEVTPKGIFEEAHQILTNKKHVMLEWDLLLKNAQRRLNHDKAFACTSCGAGYEKDWSHCKICDSRTDIVSHAKWDEYIAHEQQILKTELQAELQQLQRLQKRREKSAQPHWRNYHDVRHEKIDAWQKGLARQREEAERQRELRKQRFAEARQRAENYWAEIYLSTERA